MKPMMMLSAVYAAAFGIFLVLGSGLLMPPSGFAYYLFRKPSTS
ncbi:MAG: hypothetical protein ACM3S0_15110 [Acidobacteriota bacterium]